MLKKTSLFLIFILLLACNNKKTVAPPNYSKILNHNQMTNVLVDLYLIEAILINNMQESSNLKESTTNYYSSLFKKHQINRQQLINSMEYYCFNTKELSQIYNDVINRLAAMQTTHDEQ
ncbi:MAG: DUF4296 domain-containing protein [Bacteroidales bacterium]